MATVNKSRSTYFRPLQQQRETSVTGEDDQQVMALLFYVWMTGVSNKRVSHFLIGCQALRCHFLAIACARRLSWSPATVV